MIAERRRDRCCDGYCRRYKRKRCGTGILMVVDLRPLTMTSAKRFQIPRAVASLPGGSAASAMTFWIVTRRLVLALVVRSSIGLIFVANHDEADERSETYSPRFLYIFKTR